MQTINNLKDLVPLLAGITQRNAFCKVILDNVPAKLKTPLGRAARDFYGHGWPDSSLANGFSPSTHNGQNKAANRLLSTAYGRANRLDGLIKSCKKSSKKRGHSFTEADEQHMRDLWADAQAGKTPWTGLLDFAAYGETLETGNAGSPFSPAFDRLNNKQGYWPGNVVVVPNILNKTIKDFNRRLTIEAIVKAGLSETPDLALLQSVRVDRKQIHTYISGKGTQVFKSHPALKPYQAAMLELTKQAIYERGTCVVTGLAFVAEPGHPCMPSWDLIDQTKTGKRTWQGSGKAARLISTEPGTETLRDMRLVCGFFNVGRGAWTDHTWWTLAARVREIVKQGQIDTLLRAPF